MEQRFPAGHDADMRPGAPLVIRAGFLVASGVAAAIVSSLPASLRMGPDGTIARGLEQWVVLAAVATPLAVASVAMLRRARVGLHILAGDRIASLATTALWWGVIELAILSVVGAVLRKTTHHHALAGVTFAVFALLSGIFVAMFAQRATTMLARAGSDFQRTGLLMAGLSAFLVVMLVGVRTSRAEELHTAAALVDFVAFAVTTAIASTRILDRFRPVAIAGVPVAVLILIVGVTTLRFDAKLCDALVETAPIHGAVIDLFR